MSETTNMNEVIKNNSEILFIFDAKMCNPNGDPDDENKPRMDYERGINLVSDLRLKRYIRIIWLTLKIVTYSFQKLKAKQLMPRIV